MEFSALINAGDDYEKSRYTESRIIAVLKEVDSGRKVEEVCRQHGICSATYYNWKFKYSGVIPSVEYEENYYRQLADHTTA